MHTRLGGTTASGFCGNVEEVGNILNLGFPKGDHKMPFVKAGSDVKHEWLVHLQLTVNGVLGEITWFIVNLIAERYRNATCN